MRRNDRYVCNPSGCWGVVYVGMLMLIVGVSEGVVRGDTVTMRNGMQFTGDAARTAGIAQPANGGSSGTAGQSTVAIDDNLRRTLDRKSTRLNSSH